MCIFEMIPNAAFNSIPFPTNLVVIELYHTSVPRFIDVTVFVLIQVVLIIINFGTDMALKDFIFTVDLVMLFHCYYGPSHGCTFLTFVSFLLQINKVGEKIY